VAVAAASARRAQLVLADEPTGELDSVTAVRILDLLRERAAEGAAVLIVTHDPEVADATDREIRLRDGRVEA
jgi:putative ABC transport system ATP-binding protein